MKKPTLAEYIAYVKDNPKGYWFKNKMYGLGWVPATREGWVVTILMIGIILANALRAEAVAQEGGEAVLKQVILPTFGLVFLFLVIVWRTGEPLRWNWGPPKKIDEKK